MRGWGQGLEQEHRSQLGWWTSPTLAGQGSMVGYCHMDSGPQALLCKAATQEVSIRRGEPPEKSEHEPPAHSAPSLDAWAECVAGPLRWDEAIPEFPCEEGFSWVCTQAGLYPSIADETLASLDHMALAQVHTQYLVPTQ